MATVVDIIDLYEKAGKAIKYHRCSEDDVIPHLDEKVTIMNGGEPLTVDNFGLGYSNHFRLGNISSPGKDGKLISNLVILPER